MQPPDSIQRFELPRSADLFGRGGDRALEISDLGIRNPGKDWVSWDEIKELRVIRLDNRIDAIGRGERDTVRIEYQLQNVEDALGEIAMRAPRLSPPANAATSWEAERLPTHMILLIPGAVIVTALVLRTFIAIPPLYLGMVIVLAFLPLLSLGRGVRRVTVESDRIEVERGKEVSNLPLRDIAAVELSLYGKGRGRGILDLTVRLRLESGEAWDVTPAGVDAVGQYVALKRAVAPASR